MLRIFTNNEIYNYLENYDKADFSSLYIPVNVNYFIQKNFQELKNKQVIIEEVRQQIIKNYGTSEDGETYNFSAENREKAEKELKNLQNIKEEVEIKMIPLSKISDLQLTTVQLQALMFMIEDDGEKGDK